MQNALFDTSRPSPVPTLRIKQPYAELIFAGLKRRIFTSVRIKPGRLAIFAPHYFEAAMADVIRHKPHFVDLVDRDLQELDRSALLGLVDIVRVAIVPRRNDGRPEAQSFWRDLPDHELDRTDEIGPGQRCLWLANPRRLSVPRSYSLREEFALSDPALFEEVW